MENLIKLYEFLGFLCSGHMTNQIWSSLLEVKATSYSTNMAKKLNPGNIQSNHFVVQALPPLMYARTDNWRTATICLCMYSIVVWFVNTDCNTYRNPFYY